MTPTNPPDKLSANPVALASTGRKRHGNEITCGVCYTRAQPRALAPSNAKDAAGDGAT